MANKHQQFIRESWKTLTGDTSEIEAIWQEVVGRAMPDHEKGHALYLMGFWVMLTSKRPKGSIRTPRDYKAYLKRRVDLANRQPPTPPPPTPQPPPVAPPQPPQPSDPSPSSGLDEWPTGDITWLHTDVSGWQVTSEMSLVGFRDRGISIDHSKRGRWPVLDIANGPEVTNIEGNPWVIAKVSGRWYAATWEWMRPGQKDKGVHPTNIGQHIKRSPLDSWQPVQEEEVYFLMSAPARDRRRTVLERSNVVRVLWGRDWRR